MKTWKINFTHVAKDGLLRSGAIVVEAKDVSDANKRANEILAAKFQMPRITKTVQY